MPRRRNNCQFHEHCGNKTEVADLCRPCYDYLYYWLRKHGGKTPTQILKRQRNLALYNARLEAITNTRVLSPQPARRSRRRRAA